ncbi:helix-turn-helix domain-containing protein [Lacibacter sediminis]|uniref:AraC family transcriptional regulator n=1 Tax=Lacibacter sediminis TaxID=2760713 RepID=A0A7G5XK94_9BACT|nr:helix-turn-helix domain-containing protein [Lacibacter sediminis]QNA45897.1 AraC family transcriptional regulator [Lacibacter sediminis]
MKQSSQCNFLTHSGFLEEAITEKNSSISNYMFEMHDLASLEQNCQIENDVPTQLRHFGIIWIKNGSGSIKVDLEKYTINNNMLVCLSPGQLLLFSNCYNLDGYFMSFSSEFLLMAEGQTTGSFIDILFERRNLPLINPDEEMQSEMEVVVNMMNKEFRNYGLLRLQILKGLLKIFIVYLSSKVELKEQEKLCDRDSEMVRKFLTLVKKHFLTKKMVADYADELSVSPNYLNRIVKKISGFTASYHIQQCIVMEAKRQAIYSTLSMKEVAYFLGFNDYAHFSKFFKNNSGMNFTCFKNQVNQRA